MMKIASWTGLSQVRPRHVCKNLRRLLAQRLRRWIPTPLYPRAAQRRPITRTDKARLLTRLPQGRAGDNWSA